MYDKSRARAKPREALQNYGPKSVSDVDLIAILLGTGIVNKSVFVLANEVLEKMEKHRFKVELSDLLRIRGMGRAKATTILAALELSRRLLCPGRQRVAAPQDVLPHLLHFADRKQEHFLSVSLNGAHELVAVHLVSVGLVNKTVVHPREVFAEALTDRATAIIVAHNHPSGRVSPSREDIDVTQRLRKAGDTLGIVVLDHLIFSSSDYYSFLEKGHFDRLRPF